jgi:hypothetical protein
LPLTTGSISIPFGMNKRSVMPSPYPLPQEEDDASAPGEGLMDTVLPGSVPVEVRLMIQSATSTNANC